MLSDGEEIEEDIERRNNYSFVQKEKRGRGGGGLDLPKWEERKMMRGEEKERKWSERT